MASPEWISFYDSKHWIYVNARHQSAHCRRLAEAFLRFAPAGGVMLDFGCGESLFADRVAEPTARLILCEAAPNVRAALAGRFAGNSKIVVRKPEDIEVMTPQSIDVIIMHSVAQYLSPHDLDRQLEVFRRLLRPGGLLVLSDILPRRLSALDRCVRPARIRRPGGLLLGRDVRGCFAPTYRDTAGCGNRSGWRATTRTRWSQSSLRRAFRPSGPDKHRPQYQANDIPGACALTVKGSVARSPPVRLKPLLSALCD